MSIAASTRASVLVCSLAVLSSAAAVAGSHVSVPGHPAGALPVLLAESGDRGRAPPESPPTGLPPDVGVTGKAPHAETGIGRAHPNVQPAPEEGVADSQGSPRSAGSAASGKRPGSTGPGATEESNQGAREQRLGEKPAP